MVLNEKHNGQNQQKWLSRTNRERMNLSASVEEALEDPTVDEVSWSEELDEQSDFPRGSQGKGVFPPRLSLQSRPVPALLSNTATETPFSPQSVVSSEKERAPQNTNILKRFAQRLTSSFAALGGTSQSEVIESSLQFPAEEEASHPFGVDEDIQRTLVPVREFMPEEKAAPQLPEPLNDELRDRQGKQRLAGRTTRIHLETPPVMTPARPRQPEGSGREKFYRDPLQKRSLSGVNESAIDTEDSAAGLPESSLSESTNTTGVVGLASPLTAEQMLAGVNTTGVRLGAVDARKGKVGAATRRELSGSGVFEPGQSDATVVNRYVTEASVVLVTLTANPGPVVIQYVTLRPRIGFTVHLTAPTTMRASFNYIVLLGELF